MQPDFAPERRCWIRFKAHPGAPLPYCSWQSSVQGLERTGGCAFNEFLLGKLCRTIGYSGLDGWNADEELRMRMHEEHGAIPTITIRPSREIAEPNIVVKRILDRAAAKSG